MNNKILIYLTILIIGFIFMSALLIINQQSNNETMKQLVDERKEALDNFSNFATINSQRIFVELADTPEKRSQGLSGRDTLPENTGMLFVFDKPGVYPFWMNQMKFSIDIIWIQNDKIVDIWRQAPIPTTDNIPTYTPKAQAQYVLEVNAGFIEENNIKIGDKALIDI